MAEPVGEFSLRMANNSFATGADGTVVGTVDFEGTADGFGTVLGTLTVPLTEPGAKRGSCKWTGQAFPDDRPWLLSSGEGTWEQVEGEHRWKMSFPLVTISDGTRLSSTGEIDLPTRTFSGQMFDAS